MKLLFGILFLVAVAFSARAQFTVDWYKTSGDLGVYNPKESVHNDYDSCLYTVGMFTSGLVDFDGISISSSYPKAFFLMKTKRNGQLVWIKKIAENDYNNELTSNITLQTSVTGDVIVGITFNGKLYFGLDSTSLPDDGFTTGVQLFRLDTAGNTIWTKELYVSSIQRVGIRSDQTIFCTGRTTNDDAYLATYSLNGDSLWTKTGGSSGGLDEGKTISFDSNNNCYIAGQLEPNSGVYFDSEHPVFVSPYFKACFLAKYSPIGEILWIRCFYSSNFGEFVITRGLVIKGERIYLMGSFDGNTLKFSPSVTGLNNQGNDQTTGFLIAYDTLGNLLWKKAPHICLSGGDGLELGATLNNLLICTGSFSGSISISGETMNSSSNDLFLEAFDSLGNSVWHEQIQGSAMDGATSLIEAENDLIMNISTKSPSLAIGSSTMNLASVSNQMVLVRFNVGVLELLENELSELTVFPNPTDGVCYLSADTDLLGSIVQLFSISGELVYEQELDSKTLHVIRHELSGGLYLIRLKGSTMKPIRLIIK